MSPVPDPLAGGVIAFTSVGLGVYGFLLSPILLLGEVFCHLRRFTASDWFLSLLLYWTLPFIFLLFL